MRKLVTPCSPVTAGEGDGDGIDAEVEKFLDSADGGAIQRALDEVGVLLIGIGHADQFGTGNAAKTRA